MFLTLLIIWIFINLKICSCVVDCDNDVVVVLKAEYMGISYH